MHSQRTDVVAAYSNASQSRGPAGQRRPAPQRGAAIRRPSRRPPPRQLAGTLVCLSFQELPREQYDAQVSFNLLPSLGPESKVKLGAIEKRILAQYHALSNGALSPVAVQIVQAPVFHGYVVSLFLETEASTTVAELEKTLAGEHIDLVMNGS